jgi:diaminopropionate ammonia-lyase
MQGYTAIISEALRQTPRQPTHLFIQAGVDGVAAALAGHFMAMLECYEASLVAWRILSRTADAFMTVEEDAAVEAMKRLARPIFGDHPIVAGESGGFGLAGLIRVANNGELRAAIGLDNRARVLIINTEGATDPSRCAQLTGLVPEDVTNLR